MADMERHYTSNMTMVSPRFMHTSKSFRLKLKNCKRNSSTLKNHTPSGLTSKDEIRISEKELIGFSGNTGRSFDRINYELRDE